MKGSVKRIASATMEKVVSLEQRLMGTLTPIKPRREFVSNVAHRLQAGRQTTFVFDRLNHWHNLALLLAGVLSLGVILAVLGRLLTTLGRKGSA